MVAEGAVVPEPSAGSWSPGDADVVRVAVAGHKEQAAASRKLLAARTAFFTESSADELGCAEQKWDIEADLAELSKALAPGARKVLPALVETLGLAPLPVANVDQSAAEDELWAPLFERSGVLHAFAAAHLLGAAEPLGAARRWVAEKGWRLEAAVSHLDVDADAGSLRVALDFGLDQKCGRSLIHAAAGADSAGAVRILLEKRGDVLLDPETLLELRDGAGRTPLHVCAASDGAEAAAALVEASADLEALCALEGEDAAGEEAAEGEQGCASKAVRRWTPLHLAAMNDSAGVTELLLGARANVAACVSGVQGAHTPLHAAAEADAASAARPLALAAAAAAVDLEKLFGEVADTPADLAPAADDAAPKPEEEDPSAVRWSRFLDPLNAKCGPHGSTPLHVATENDAAGVVAALLDAKADPGLGDDQGDTPLHCAALYGAPGALGELLRRGASAMAENDHGEQPLHLCAEFGCADDTEPAPSEAAARRHFAKSDRARELLLAALRERGQLAAALGHRAKGGDGGTPLHKAARLGHPGAAHAARLLAEARADLELRDAEGRTAFGVAVRSHGAECRVAAVLRAMGCAEDTAAVEEAPPPSEAPSGSAQSSCGPSGQAADGGDHEDPLAKALGGCIRPIQMPEGPLDSPEAAAAGAARAAMEVDTGQGASSQDSLVLPLMADSSISCGGGDSSGN